MAITRYLKIGEEANYGEEATEYDETLDPETANLESGDDDKLIYEGMSGLDRIVGLGVYSTSGSITLPVDDLATGWFFKWALGGYEVTGTDDGSGNMVAPFTHMFYPQRSALMKSFSAKIGKDIFEHIFLGNVVESIEIEMDSEWALMTVNAIGSKDKRSTLEENIEFTEGNLFTAPMASLTKDGIDVSPKINSLSLSIETGASIEDSAGFGSRFPTKACNGSLVVSLELTLGFDDMTELEAFWGDISGPSENNIEEVSYTLNLGNSLDFIFPRLVYTASNQPAEGRDFIEQSVTARALYDPTTQEGPIIISLTNSKETYAKG